MENETCDIAPVREDFDIELDDPTACRLVYILSDAADYKRSFLKDGRREFSSVIRTLTLLEIQAQAAWKQINNNYNRQLNLF